MGTWGTKAWENDSAADWFGDLMDKTQLAEQVRTALAMNPEEDPEIVRAAAHVVEQLGHAYIWPIQSLDQDVRLAIDALGKLAANSDMPRAEIRKSIRALKSRLQPGNNNASTTAKKSSDASPSKPAADVPVSAAGPATTLQHRWSTDMAPPERRKHPPGDWTSNIFEASVLDLVVLRNNQLLTTSGEWISVLDSTTGQVLWREDEICRNTFMRRCHTADADYFVVTGPAPESVVRRITDGKVLHKLAHGTAAASDLSADGSRLLVLMRNGAVNLFDVESGKLLRELEHAITPNADSYMCHITPDGRYGITQRKKDVRIWNLDSGQQIAKRASKYNALITADGQALLCSSATGGSLVDLASGKITRKFTTGQMVFPWDSTVSSDHRWIVDLKRSSSTLTIEGVRQRTDEHSPVTLAQGRGCWLDNMTLVTTRREPVKNAPGELLVWKIQPQTLVASVAIDKQFVTEKCGDPNYDAHFDIMRMAVDRKQKTIFAGDRDSHVHAFAFPELD